MPNDLRHEVIYARLWAGLHYHLSSVAGVVLGRQVAKFDLRHAFQPVGSTIPTVQRGGRYRLAQLQNVRADAVDAVRLARQIRAMSPSG